MQNEFEIIRKFFQQQNLTRPDVALNIGDDAAIVNIPTDQQLVVTTDTLISGVHFPKETTADAIGHKALAVNLSDLAAMGATPAWVTLAMSLPDADELWLKNFSQSFFRLANQYHTQLIGGDLTRGALSITVTALGLVPKNKALTRAGANAGDLIYVTNTLGDAALALKYLHHDNLSKNLLRSLNYPEPRIAIGEKLRGIASAAIDISDGLLADLGHILESSGKGARIELTKIPLSKDFLMMASEEEKMLALNGGDDYELCFTVPATRVRMLETVLKDEMVSCIGVVTEGKQLELDGIDGKLIENNFLGYKHF